jgi:hypothetical protein
MFQSADGRVLCVPSNSGIMFTEFSVTTLSLSTIFRTGDASKGVATAGESGGRKINLQNQVVQNSS